MLQLTLRRTKERARLGWMRIALGLMLLMPLAIGFTLLWKALPLFSLAEIGNILFGTEWAPLQGKFGLWPFISSSLLVAFAGMLLMIPIALSAALYITQFAPAWLARLLRAVIDVLAGIPSVIFGLWGVLTLVPLVAGWAEAAGASNASGYSVLTAAMVMAVSVMPFVLNLLLELFGSVPVELKESALSLGTSYWQMVRDVILKKTRPGITAAFSLGMSKAFGETIAVLMVVGNVVQVPGGLFDAGYPLPALLANNYGEMMSIPLYDAALMLCALLLLIIVVLFNFFAHALISHYHSKN